MVIFQAYKWEVKTTDENINIYIFGLNRKNQRCVVKIPDFKPWAYLELENKHTWTTLKVNSLLQTIRDKISEPEINMPIKQNLVTKLKNYYYKKGQFLHLFFNSTTNIKQFDYICNRKLNVPGLGYVSIKLHEKKVDPVLQLMALQKIKPSSWIKVNHNLKYPRDSFSNCDIEIVASFKDLVQVEINHVCNPLVLSYDIECISGDKSGNTFPDPKLKTDKIICISATVANLSDTQDKWKVYSLVNEENGTKHCPNVDNCNIKRFQTEKDLLLGWRDFMNAVNPDVITGYNTLSFDDNFVYERVQLKGIWSEFSKQGRLTGVSATKNERKWQSSAYGEQSFNYFDIPGRLHLDMFPIISKDFGNLMSYSLDFVSEHFLDDHKLDLPAKEMIQKWHAGGEKNIAEIVEYCNKDTLLPIRLMKKLNSWIGLLEMSNVMMVQVFDMITRGQQIRVFSQVYCLTIDLNVVCLEKWADYKPTDDEKMIVGATVQNPRSGYWEKVATYDFKSLYPTTIIAYNICFSTFIPPGENPPPEKYHNLFCQEHCGCEHDHAERKTKVKKVICKDNYYRFWKAEYKKGIVPTILKGLLDARDHTKGEIKTVSKKMATVSDPDELRDLKMLLEVLDKRQNGYKISANSMYGGFGSDFSFTPFYPAAASTTAMGRKSIHDAIEFAKGYRPDTVVVYGDSVTADTPVLLKHKNGEIYIKEISQVAQEQEWEEYGDFKPTFTEPIDTSIENYVAEDGGLAVLAARHLFNQNTRFCKEQKLLGDWQVWTDSGWSDITRVIRHKTVKKIYRVTTHTGTVDVTQDHSLLTSTGEQVKPVDVKIGDHLLHSFPDVNVERLSAECENKDYTFNKKVLMQILWFTQKQNGNKNLELNVENGNFKINTQLITETKTCVKQIEPLGKTRVDEYVYDLETASGRFQAGIGEMIVKNTDSCMLHFRNIDTLEHCFEICEEMETKINSIFPKPMYLELEKIYEKYLLLSKKRYVGYIVDKKGALLSIDKKGVVIKRRDNCGYLKEIYTQLIKMVMENKGKGVNKIYKYLAEKIDALLNGNVPIEQLIIVKSIKGEYKATNLPQIQVAKKMKERGKYVTAGTRISYIFVETENKKDPQYLKAEDPDWYLKNQDTLKIDYLYYLEKQISTPVDEVLEIVFKKQNIISNFVKLLKKTNISVYDYLNCQDKNKFVLNS